MHLKRNLLSIAIGTAFLVTQFVTPAIAADTTQGSNHQHQSGQHSEHNSHSNTKSEGQHDHGHKCEHKMSSVDTNNDGKISKEEFMKHHEAMFDKKDTNKDGFLDETERRSMKEKMHKHMHDHGKKQQNGNHVHGDKKE
ncbi:EF-hand domain-containing protein [Nitrosomonas ureae]|uniref:EF hand domain-containing protein n=1 Tax=Nitrosomonas ureae TaxID=44577 RepID=A0A2T5IQL4_9PROT|nr:EF-hand domain-containing protein [Nitrosomonas ureae]PTQ86109.1 EF hand domain-containing protein [Nitrosomonas ureae]